MYSVANFLFRVILPEGRDADMLLPSFRPFHVSEEGGPVLFTLKVNDIKGEGKRVTGEGEAAPLAVSGIKGDGGRVTGEGGASPLTVNEDVPNGPLTAHRSPFTESEGPFPLHPSPFPLHPSPFPLLLEDENDMGHLRLYDHPEGYLLHLHYDARWVHTLLVDKAFHEARVWVHWEDPYVESVLCSMLRIVYSQAILPHGAISLHASVVTNEGRGYLFMGVSGTGKSTHSRLWMEHVPGSELLNDDNPIIRLMEDGRPYVFGSPWSGKTPCYRAHGVPVGGMAQLQQAPMNRFHEQDPISAFSLVLPGCSVVRADGHLFNALCDTLAEICTVVKVGLLECLPDRNAAIQCAEYLKNVNI